MYTLKSSLFLILQAHPIASPSLYIYEKSIYHHMEVFMNKV